MRQVWMMRRGGPEVLKVREAPDPEPEAGQVRIRAKAAGVNFADILIRQGLYPTAPKLPAVVGYEVAGVVDAVGEGIAEDILGRRVVALMPRYGGYSDCVVIPAGEAVPIPNEMSFEAAAAVPVNYMTAWLMLMELGNVKSGDRVLVHSAAGGVGQAAVQICRWQNARVIGTASAPKHKRLKGNGVEYCIDSRTPNFCSEVMNYTEGRGVDIALDALGGKALAESYRCLAPLGRLFTFGVSRMVTGTRRNLLRVFKEWWTMPRFNPLDLLQRSRGVMGVTLECLKHDPERRRQMLTEILAQVRERHFAPCVDRTFQFEEAAEAHRYLQDRKNFGKVILVP